MRSDTTPSPIAQLFATMAAQHGVASTRQARVLGIDSRVERRLVQQDILSRPVRGALASPAAPHTWEQRAIAATFACGDAVLSHGAAARLHGLDGFERHDVIDVLCRKGSWPIPPPGTIARFTRGLGTDDITVVASIPVLTIATTLVLLPPVVGLEVTARALDSALRAGHHLDELREAATRWRRRGRSGPPMVLRLIDQRDVRHRRG
jgi:hypothetical protein